MRGLKRARILVLHNEASRIFYRCVDWNSLITAFCSLLTVASFTDAWIETIRTIAKCVSEYVASFTDAWIETCIMEDLTAPEYCRIFYRCVDWNYFWGERNRRQWWSHLLQMRGLKQLRVIKKSRSEKVASFTDAWIETIWGLWIDGNVKSHLLQMRGLKLTQSERLLNV